jgi:DNA processing protein
MAFELSAGLASAGIIVVSGLALGIDSAAHRGALEGGGLTVAVMGTGPDQVYPPANRRLAEHIASRGALVTEFAPGSPPLRDHFPRRNRIIAGIADAVVVVEAGARSGALITVGWALEAGRPVLATPGRAGDPLAEGTLALIRDGAALACSVEDILTEVPSARRAFLGPAPEPRETNDAEQGEAGPVSGGSWGSDPDAAAILAILPVDDELHIDAILARLEQPTERVLAALFMLQLGGLLEALPGGFFRRTGAARPGGPV